MSAAQPARTKAAGKKAAAPTGESGAANPEAMTTDSDSGEVGEVGEGVAEDPVVHGQSQQFLFRGAESLRRSIEEQISYFQRRTYIKDSEDLRQHIAKDIAVNLKGDFCWSLHFSPRFYSELCWEGFLPICSEISGRNDLHVLLPKLHEDRCVLKWADLHISKKARKKCNGYRLTVNEAFEEVLAGVKKQHGDNWIYPPIRDILRCFNRGARPAFKASVCTFELWDTKTNVLVAGDLGIVCGAVYTSFSGFYFKDGAGTIQICAMARLLQRSGFDFLDLGQFIEYKKSFGAKTIPRAEFLSLHHAARAKAVPTFEKTDWPCAELVKQSAACS